MKRPPLSIPITRYWIPLGYQGVAIVQIVVGNTASAITFLVLALFAGVVTLCRDLYIRADITPHTFSLYSVDAEGRDVWKCDVCKSFQTADKGDAFRHHHMTPYQRMRTRMSR